MECKFLGHAAPAGGILLPEIPTELDDQTPKWYCGKISKPPTLDVQEVKSLGHNEGDLVDDQDAEVIGVAQEGLEVRS